MMMAHRANRKNKSNKFLCDSNTHPQTTALLLLQTCVYQTTQGNNVSPPHTTALLLEA
jgi:glycine cleavage system pyridoxal-binding protein P